MGGKNSQSDGFGNKSNLNFPGAVYCNFNGSLLSLDGNLGRNSGVTPWTVFNDIRVSRRISFGERMSMDAMVDIFNIANRYNVAAVSPLYTNAGQATAAYDPRQIQFGLKVNW